MNFSMIIVWRGINGTVLEIHNNENLRETCGYIENQNTKMARVRASVSLGRKVI
ncbi:Uncharacterised protein [Clostridium putrefaciens]|uniref:Uncharacterized protein n=1 Tax=Clostridium putrefaciens TaxID=99675 RepID=A0A381J736_9CLOT|nr:hypothetical protein [Clostridium putrefaciens]SUY46518.1 Uncharacterised protein [Clostridium putrefaciens]